MEHQLQNPFQKHSKHGLNRASSKVLKRYAKLGFNGEFGLLKKPSPAGKGDHEVVDEESIFVLIKGDLLIRHGFAVPPSPLEKAWVGAIKVRDKS